MIAASLRNGERVEIRRRLEGIDDAGRCAMMSTAMIVVITAMTTRPGPKDHYEEHDHTSRRSRRRHGT